VLGGIKQESDEDRLEWNKLSALLKVYKFDLIS